MTNPYAFWSSDSRHTTVNIYTWTLQVILNKEENTILITVPVYQKRTQHKVSQNNTVTKAAQIRYHTHDHLYRKTALVVIYANKGSTSLYLKILTLNLHLLFCMCIFPQIDILLFHSFLQFQNSTYCLILLNLRSIIFYKAL